LPAFKSAAMAPLLSAVIQSTPSILRMASICTLETAIGIRKRTTGSEVLATLASSRVIRKEGIPRREWRGADSP